MDKLHRASAFIFDLDNTLIASEKYHVIAFARAMRELGGYTFTEADEKEFSGNTSRDFCTTLRERHGLDYEIDELVDAKFRFLDEIFATEPFPGVLEFLSLWRGRVKFAVASNSPRPFVTRALKDLGIYSELSALRTIEDVAHKKPDPEMFRLVLDDLSLAPEEALIFEDSELGVQAALAAGCPLFILENPDCQTLDVVPEGMTPTNWPELLAGSRSGAGGKCAS